MNNGSFQLFRDDGQVWVWHRQHEAIDPRCRQGTVQAGCVSVMVWGLFAWPGSTGSPDQGPLGWTARRPLAGLQELHIPPQRGEISAGSCTMSSGPNCPELVQGVFWRVYTTAVATLFTWYELHPAFMGRGGEVHLLSYYAPTNRREQWVAIQTFRGEGSTSHYRCFVHWCNQCYK